jgi:hypothetical protein
MARASSRSRTVNEKASAPGEAIVPIRVDVFIGRAISEEPIGEQVIAVEGTGGENGGDTPITGFESAVDATVHGTGPGRLQADDTMARQLSDGFAEAARQAVQEAHAVGLAVPARENGIAVEIRPDGEIVPIDDDAPWSPTDWRKSAKR